MNPLQSSPASADRDALQARFARRIVLRLNESADQIGGDVSERLRFAREQAVSRTRSVHTLSTAPARTGATAAGAAMLGGGSEWWVRLAAALPLLALLIGLVLIQQWQTTAQISVAAEVDAALLADDLPPSAYRDAGFVEFLKIPPRE